MTTALLFIIINKGIYSSNNKIQITAYARLTGNGAYSNTPSSAPATTIIKIQKYIMEEKILV